MISIVKATENDFSRSVGTIQEIAYKTWPVTYKEILSDAQLKYMLELFYSENALNKNMTQDGHHFLLAIEDGICLGFAGIEHNYNQNNRTRIHKIYILPEAQGKGIGRLLIDEIETLAKENHSSHLSLNVNRFNNALLFYQKLGFEIIKEEDIELHFGYLMEDFQMEKIINC
jgi:GNAT superfamily N-acetyltransferase